MFERLPPSRRFLFHILFFTFCLCAMFIFFSSGVSTFNTKKYVINFDRSVSGLKVGNFIYYMGVPVGVVHDIKIDLPSAKRICVVVKINKKLPLYKGCYAQMGMQGLTGNSVLEISNDRASKELLVGSLPEIKSAYSTMEKLTHEVPQLISNTNALIKVLHELVMKNRTTIDDSIVNFGTALRSLNGALVEIKKGASVFYECGKKTHQDILPNIQNASVNFAELVKQCRTDWDAFSTGGMVQLMDLINNLNNITAYYHDAIDADHSYVGYILGLR